MATLPPPRIRFALIIAPEGEDRETETVRLSRTQQSNGEGHWTGFTSFPSANQSDLTLIRTSAPFPGSGEGESAPCLDCHAPGRGKLFTRSI